MNNGSVGIDRLSISMYSLFNRQMKRALITSKQTAIFFPGSLRRLCLWVRGKKGARFARTPTWKHAQLWMSRLFCDPDMQHSPVRCLLVIYSFTYSQAIKLFLYAYCIRWLHSLRPGLIRAYWVSLQRPFCGQKYLPFFFSIGRSYPRIYIILLSSRVWAHTVHPDIPDTPWVWPWGQFDIWSLVTHSMKYNVCSEDYRKWASLRLCWLWRWACVVHFC